MSCIVPSLGCDAFSPDVTSSLDRARPAGFDFIITPLFSVSNRRHVGASGASLLRPSQWANLIVGSLDTTSISGDGLSDEATADIESQFSWAAHVGVRIVVTSPFPDNRDFSRIILSALNMQGAPAIWIRAALAEIKGDSGDSSWEHWNALRVATSAHDSLFVCLEVNAGSNPSREAIDRWLAEPVRALRLSTANFTLNAAGFPVLSAALQEIVKLMISRRVQILITGAADALFLSSISAASAGSSTNEEAIELKNYVENPLRAYAAYIHHLSRSITPQSDREDAMERYVDALQMPLQPLSDNLESSSYEVFEDDAAKYDAYERAITEALRDSPEAREVTIIFVVGAGRGPLVSRVLAASRATKRAVRIYAVDKNPNAIITLRTIIEISGWQDVVTVVQADMRSWKAPELAHMLVSELLGSFGDNELSPECLDCAHGLLAADGITIPQAYTSFLAPISACKLWSDVRRLDDPKWFDTSFVAKMRRIHAIAPAKPLFSFQHYGPPRTPNNRSASITFQAVPGAPKALMHGFAGYFEALLYKDIKLSTLPETHTAAMLSWFPLFIPLKNPIVVDGSRPLTAHFWRRGDASRVWYEWAIAGETRIHNSRGWASSISLT